MDSDKNIGKAIGEFTFTRKLGQGAFGYVYEAKDKIGNLVAVKMIPKSAICNDKLEKMLLSEVNVSKMASHKNLVKLTGLVHTKTNYYIVYEYCDQGNLDEYVKKNPSINEELAIGFLRDICNGYQALYKANIIHRDIKLANIFLTKDTDGKIIAKIGDYGFSKMFPTQEKNDIPMTQIMAVSFLGSPIYMSPELLSEDKYNYQSDIFSIGVAFYFMLFCSFPFYATSKKDLRDKYNIGNVEFDLTKKTLSEFTIDFLMKCLAYKPECRLKMTDVMSHVLITEDYSMIKSNSIGGKKVIMNIHL